MMELLDYLAQMENLVFSGGKDDGKIQEVEEKLGLKFSEEYKKYLRKYGSVSYENHELTGLNRSKRLNVVDCTFEQRKSNDCLLPDMYVVEDLGIDGIIVLQRSDGTVYMLFSYDNEISKVAGSLVEYLQKG